MNAKQQFQLLKRGGLLRFEDMAPNGYRLDRDRAVTWGQNGTGPILSCPNCHEGKYSATTWKVGLVSRCPTCKKLFAYLSQSKTVLTSIPHGGVGVSSTGEVYAITCPVNKPTSRSVE